MEKTTFLLLCMTSLLLCMASCVKKDEAASNEITVYGNVIDKTNGTALSNVMIKEMNNVGGSTVTGTDGNYEFKLPLNGSSNSEYTLVASKDGYSSSEYTLKMSDVDKDRRVKVDFQLAQNIGKQSCTYTGKVVDRKGSAISGASVFLYRTPYEEYPAWLYDTSITNSKGEYTIEVDAADITGQLFTIKMIASHPNYESSIKEFISEEEQNGKTIRVNFELLIQ